jgi:hypothetical protein
VWGFRAPAPLDEGGAPGQDRAFVLGTAGGEEGHADGIGRLFAVHGHRYVEHRHYRMTQKVQKAHQRGVPDHRRGAPGVAARRGQHTGIIDEQFLTEMQLLLDGIVEPVDAATGSRGDGHVRGEAEEFGRDGGPHTESLGDLRMLPERCSTGIAGARLRHPEGAGVGPWEGETEQPTEAEQAGEPRAQTSRTWHRVSSGSWPSPEGQAGL